MSKPIIFVSKSTIKELGLILPGQIGNIDVRQYVEFDEIIIEEEKIKLHITEQKYPEQVKRFREILDEMYQTHLNKNADYSSWNINATGLIGLVVRFWDKSARIMNLCGFDIGTGDFSGNKQNLVKDETIIDTFKDAGVYSIIARIWAEGKWGK